MATDREKEDIRRVFTVNRDGEDVEYFIGVPSSEDIRKADWHYSKVYNKALIDGVATEAEMLDILRARGLYGDDHQDKLNKLGSELAEKIAAMEMESSPIVRRELALEVSRLRRDVFQWNQRLTGPLSNTCEEMANQAKSEYLTSAIVQNKDGTRVWDDYDSFLAEEDQGLSLSARLEVLLWLQGLDTDFMENTPENVVLREIEQAENTPKLEVPKEDDSVEAEVDTTEDPAPAPKKKRGRKAVAKKK